MGAEHSFDAVCIGGRPVWHSLTHYRPGPLEVLENPWIRTSLREKLFCRIVRLPCIANLDVVIGFSSTFHAKAISYGNTEVPNCLNCHAPYELGFSPHRITSRKNANSPTHPDNKHTTCSQSGCHINANKAFASVGYVHPSPQRIKTIKISAPQDVDARSQEQIRFQNTVIELVQLFYMILITLVIGGLALHRLIELYASIRARKLGEH